jgi:hypothetical protein
MADSKWIAFFVRFAMCVCYNTRTIDHASPPISGGLEFRGFPYILAMQNHTSMVERLCVRGEHSRNWDRWSYPWDIRNLLDWAMTMPKLHTLQVHSALLGDPSL